MRGSEKSERSSDTPRATSHVGECKRSFCFLSSPTPLPLGYATASVASRPLWPQWEW